MTLSDKIFGRPTKACDPRSDCQAASDRECIGSLFERDWEVFVIKRDPASSKFSWFTACCEADGIAIDAHTKLTSAACC